MNRERTVLLLIGITAAAAAQAGTLCDDVPLRSLERPPVIGPARAPRPEGGIPAETGTRPSDAASTRKGSSDVPDIDVDPGIRAASWDAIVVHAGNAHGASFAEISERFQPSSGFEDGVPFHFIVEGSEARSAQPTERWRRQRTAGSPGVPEVAPKRSISVLMTGIGGDPEASSIAATRTLLEALRSAYKIPAAKVLIHESVEDVRRGACGICPARAVLRPWLVP